jgi:hypothetical protein
VGGDFMHARQLLGDDFLLVAPLAVIPLRRGDRTALASFAAILVWSAVSLVAFELPYQGVDTKHYINDEHTIWRGELGADNPINVVDSSGPPPMPNAGRFHLAGNAGIQGVALVKHGLYDVVFLEWCGLGDPIASRQSLLRRGRIGHEKCRNPTQDPWTIARFPGLEPWSLAKASDVALARSVLEDSLLGDYLDAITQPLTLAVFFRNVVRSPTYTRFRVIPLRWIRAVPEHRRDAPTLNRMMLEREHLQGPRNRGRSRLGRLRGS